MYPLVEYQDDLEQAGCDFRTSMYEILSQVTDEGVFGAHEREVMSSHRCLDTYSH